MTEGTAERHFQRRFHNQTLILDGSVFEACRFINPDLRYEGGQSFRLSNCSFEGSVNLAVELGSPLSAEMVDVLDAAFRESGFDLELAISLKRWRSGPVFRMHTCIPCH